MEKIFKCSICEQKVDANKYYDRVKLPMLKYQICYTCNFWRDLYETDIELGKYKYAIIGGHHYKLLPPTNDVFQGFGGREVIIRFFDSTTVKCKNLWHQGKVPEKFKDLFPDNAEFINSDITKASMFL